MGKKSEAWEWFTVLIPKTHPDVQCNYCGTVIRNAQLGRDLLPHSSDQCPDAPDEVEASAWEQIDKSYQMKETRRPTGGAAHSRMRRIWKRAYECFAESEDEEEERKRLYWEGKERYWRMLEEQGEQDAA